MSELPRRAHGPGLWRGRAGSPSPLSSPTGCWSPTWSSRLPQSVSTWLQPASRRLQPLRCSRPGRSPTASSQTRCRRTARTGCRALAGPGMVGRPSPGTGAATADGTSRLPGGRTRGLLQPILWRLERVAAPRTTSWPAGIDEVLRRLLPRRRSPPKARGESSFPFCGDRARCLGAWSSPRSSASLPRPATSCRSPTVVSFAEECAIAVRRRLGLPPARAADLDVAARRGVVVVVLHPGRELGGHAGHHLRGTPPRQGRCGRLLGCRSQRVWKLPSLRSS